MSNTSKSTYETSIGKPGATSIVIGITLIIIATLVMLINVLDGSASAFSYEPPTFVLLTQTGGIPLGAFLVIAGYLYRISRAIEVAGGIESSKPTES